MITLEQASQYIGEQNKKRELWVGNDDPDELAKMIHAEAGELVDSIQEAMVNDSPFEVASEIGDVGYLLIRLCDALGINLMDAVEMKIVRNSYKYPDHVMSNGRDYPTATKVSKDAWKAMGGDVGFSHAYLDYLATEDHAEERKYPINLFGITSDGTPQA